MTQHMNHLRTGSLLFLSCLLMSIGIAQEQDIFKFSTKIEKFGNASDSSSVELPYLEIPSQEALLQLAEELLPDTVENNSYPLIVLEKSVFLPGIRLVKGLELQLLNYELKDKEWQILDSINNEEIAVLKEIAQIERQRVDVQKEANKDLNEQIQNLSEQLKLSTELTETSLKGRTRKNIYIGVLGGIFGFSLGAILGILADRGT